MIWAVPFLFFLHGDYVAHKAAVTSHIEAKGANTEATTAHTLARLAYTETTTAYVVDVAAHIEAKIAYATVVVAHEEAIKSRTEFKTSHMCPFEPSATDLEKGRSPL